MTMITGFSVTEKKGYHLERISIVHEIAEERPGLRRRKPLRTMLQVLLCFVAVLRKNMMAPKKTCKRLDFATDELIPWYKVLFKSTHSALLGA